MRHVLRALSTLLIASVAEAQQVSRAMQNVVPAEARVEQIVATRDEKRTYFTTPTGGLFLYDRDRKTTTQITPAMVWDISVSPNGTAIAYTKTSAEDRRQQFVWILPLNSSTGLSAGAERMLSRNRGDVPSFSPDGKLIAFARDDSTGVGQSIVIVPIAGGTERVVVAALPAGVRSIQWTPDGRTLYFGVNPPVPFTCAESCLSLARESRPMHGSIRSVAATGGRVSIIATTNAPTPGLSPDGTILVYGDIERPGFVVADANGKRIDALPMQNNQVLRGWLGAATLLTSPNGNRRPPGSGPPDIITGLDLGALRESGRAR